jgi:hypothetical protein
MNKKERIAPVALMFIAAGLSFLVCEGLSHLNSLSAQQKVELAQIVPIQPAQASLTPPPEQPRSFAQRIVQKINHAVHSSAQSANLMENSTAQRESGLKTVQPESEASIELNNSDVAALSPGPLDLSLVPGVVVLPKAQEPLASAGLYDKRAKREL